VTAAVIVALDLRVYAGAGVQVVVVCARARARASRPTNSIVIVREEEAMMMRSDCAGGLVVWPGRKGK